MSKSIWDAIKDPFFMRNVSNVMLLLPDEQLSLFRLFVSPSKNLGITRALKEWWGNTKYKEMFI